VRPAPESASRLWVAKSRPRPGARDVVQFGEVEHAGSADLLELRRDFLHLRRVEPPLQPEAAVLARCYLKHRHASMLLTTTTRITRFSVFEIDLVDARPRQVETQAAGIALRHRRLDVRFRQRGWVKAVNVAVDEFHVHVVSGAADPDGNRIVTAGVVLEPSS